MQELSIQLDMCALGNERELTIFGEKLLQYFHISIEAMTAMTIDDLLPKHADFVVLRHKLRAPSGKLTVCY